MVCNSLQTSLCRALVGLYKMIGRYANQVSGSRKFLLIGFLQLQLLDSKFKHQYFCAYYKNISDTKKINKG